MPTAIIHCPGCGARYNLKAASLESVASQTFRCPKCRYACSLGRMMGSHGFPKGNMHTHIGGSAGRTPDEFGKTRIVGSASGEVVLEVEGTGRNFRLGMGNYILGRDSDDSRASVKIAPDRYMSRQQAVLEIQPSRQPGGKPEARIINNSQTNAIYVNERKLDNGMSIVLNNGDKLLLGMTKVNVRL